jgi:hypothetical protein
MELVEKYTGKYRVPSDDNNQSIFDVNKEFLKTVSRFDVVKVRITDLDQEEKTRLGIAQKPITVTFKFKNAAGVYIGFDAVVHENVEGEAWASYTSIADCHKSIDKIHVETLEVISDVKCTYELKLFEAN